MKKKNIHLQVLYSEEGKKTGVILAVKEFEKLIEELEDLHDLITAYKRLDNVRYNESPKINK